jgi:exonuclease SbcC
LKDAREHATGAAEKLHDELTKAGLADRAAFQRARLDSKDIESLEERVKRHAADQAAAIDRAARADTEALSAWQRYASDAAGAAGEIPALLAARGFSLAALVEREAAARGAREQLVRDDQGLEVQVEQLGGWIAKARELEASGAELESKFGVLGHVADVAGGKNGPRLTFERYVLGALLDDVLMAASRRLELMSKGRYLLRRVLKQADGRLLGGLDLAVHDGYSGLERPVNTLSGGESFLASLALALGLADVVQGYSGGIRLDTLFVDEGFGSLDPEALELALRALVDLQHGGRLVGVISHVPELRERIDVRLEVTADRRGSRARFDLK